MMVRDKDLMGKSVSNVIDDITPYVQKNFVKDKRNLDGVFMK